MTPEEERKHTELWTCGEGTEEQDAVQPEGPVLLRGVQQRALPTPGQAASTAAGLLPMLLPLVSIQPAHMSANLLRDT
jgi:hypothetical protein